MAEILKHVQLKEGAATHRSYGSPVEEILFANGTTLPQVMLGDKRSGTGTCLGCLDAPCIQRPASPTTTNATIRAFPQDPALELCPTDAITIDTSVSVAKIDVATCIKCGLCALRCPYGAIHLSQAGPAVVTSTDPSKLLVTGTPALFSATLTRSGRIGPVQSPALAEIATAVQSLNDRQALRFVANLFIALGVDARVRRRGDTNMRIDGLLEFSNGRIGVMEVEVSPNAVESPRALLEDVAVLRSRYAIPIEEIYPVSVLLTLPNQRSEYYQVMRDIKTAVGVECRSLTIGALLVMAWNNGRLSNLEGLFLTSETTADLGVGVRAIIGRDEAEPYSGAFRPAK